MQQEKHNLLKNVTKNGFNWKKLLRTNGPTLFINVACPLLIYSMLTTLFRTPEFIALLATCLPSLLDSIRSIIQQKRINILALLVLLSIGLGLVLIALGISSRIFLARDAFFTMFVGIAALVSLPFSRPLGFYALQRLREGGSPEQMNQLYVRWQYPPYRTSLRVRTAIVGIGIVMEGVLRISLTFVFSPIQFLSLSPLITMSIAGLVVAIIASYTKLWLRQHSTRLLQHEQKNALVSLPDSQRL